FAEEVGVDFRVPVARAVADAHMPRLRQLTERHHHFWQGRPGLWRQFLPGDLADRIANAHRESLAELNYVCRADSTLDRDHADANWIKLNGTELTESLRTLSTMRHEFHEAKKSLHASEHQLMTTTSELRAARRALAEVECE